MNLVVNVNNRLTILLFTVYPLFTISGIKLFVIIKSLGAASTAGVVAHAHVQERGYYSKVVERTSIDKKTPIIPESMEDQTQVAVLV